MADEKASFERRELILWTFVDTLGLIEGYQEYLRIFPNGYLGFRAKAKAKIKDIDYDPAWLKIWANVNQSQYINICFKQLAFADFSTLRTNVFRTTKSALKLTGKKYGKSWTLRDLWTKQEIRPSYHIKDIKKGSQLELLNLNAKAYVRLVDNRIIQRDLLPIIKETTEEFVEEYPKSVLRTYAAKKRIAIKEEIEANVSPYLIPNWPFSKYNKLNGYYLIVVWLLTIYELIFTTKVEPPEAYLVLGLFCIAGTFVFWTLINHTIKKLLEKESAYYYLSTTSSLLISIGAVLLFYIQIDHDTKTFLLPIMVVEIILFMNIFFLFLAWIFSLVESVFE